MKFVDLNSEYQYFKTEIDKNVKQVLDSGWFLLGQQTELLEEEFANFIGRKHCTVVSNCTDAIVLALKRIGQQKKSNNFPIVLPNFGAYPTAVAASQISNNLYFVDVDRTMTINPNKLPKNIYNGVVIAVHLFGNNCDLDSIESYCRTNNHFLIEDCAQSTGSGSGKKGIFSVFSFYPTKPLASMGDGGAICYDYNFDKEWFEQARFYGQQKKTIKQWGLNLRTDEWQSAIIRAKLPRFMELTEKRKNIAERYLKIVKGINWEENAVFHQFPILVKHRYIFEGELKNNNIPFMIHYNEHVSETPYFYEKQKFRKDKVGYRVNTSIISLPINPFMTEEETQKVEEFLEKNKHYEI